MTRNQAINRQAAIITQINELMLEGAQLARDHNLKFELRDGDGFSTYLETDAHTNGGEWDSSGCEWESSGC